MTSYILPGGLELVMKLDRDCRRLGVSGRIQHNAKTMSALKRLVGLESGLRNRKTYLRIS
jgi:hypothetical protein